MTAYLGYVTLVGVLPAALRKTALDIVQGVKEVRGVQEEAMSLTAVEQPVASLFQTRCLRLPDFFSRANRQARTPISSFLVWRFAVPSPRSLR